jgi:hypothetical protein
MTNEAVRLCEFEQDGETIETRLRPIGDGWLELELADGFPAQRCIRFNEDLLRRLIDGETRCIGCHEGQCAISRTGDAFQIVFCDTEIGVRVECEVPAERLIEAARRAAQNPAYLA